MGELGAKVGEVTKRTTIEEGALVLPEIALDARLRVGLAAHGARAKLVVRGEREKAWIVDGLMAFPAEHDGFLPIVGAAPSATSEAREGTHVAVHERVQT